MATARIATFGLTGSDGVDRREHGQRAAVQVQRDDRDEADQRHGQDDRAEAAEDRVATGRDGADGPAPGSGQQERAQRDHPERARADPK